ncbi:MAG: DUF115 domain-containing protein [Bacteroidetes bacterium]|nr:DUF115 domain-containing protein [Bacteroidota bacterium]
MMRSKLGNDIPQNEAETCLVLGNGPSLKTSLEKHPEIFRRHSLVCVNSFSTTEEYTSLKPQYYVILDYGYWMSDARIILDTIEALKTRTSWTVDLFIPQMASGSKRFKDLCKVNKNIRLHYFNYTVFKGFPTIAHWFYKKNMAMPQSQNVLVAAIFLAINIGFKKITILGADHTWHQNLHLDENNILFFKDVHFHDKEEKINYIPFKKGLHIVETFKVHELFTAFSKAFYGYIVLEKYAVSKNCKIYNASEISFVDAFERKKL